MTKQEIIDKIGESRWGEFTEWMYGQTVGMYPDGTIDYYENDVDRFIRGLPVID